MLDSTLVYFFISLYLYFTFIKLHPFHVFNLVIQQFDCFIHLMDSNC